MGVHHELGIDSSDHGDLRCEPPGNREACIGESEVTKLRLDERKNVSDYDVIAAEVTSLY